MKITDLPGIGDTTPGAADKVLLNWINAAVRSIVATLNSPDMTGPANYVLTGAHAGKTAVDVAAKLKEWRKILQDPEKLDKLAETAPYDFVAWVLRHVTGLSFTGTQIQTIVEGNLTPESRRALGQILTDLYGETLQTEKVAQGWIDRNPGENELENFRQLSGAAMRIQLGDLVVGALGDAIPFNLGSILTNVAEKINSAVALDDALEEVVQVPMQAVIQRGLEAKYNRELKPQDYTESEVRNAFLQGRITDDVYKKVLDNQGVRDDIRDTLLDMAEPDLTEADVDQAYQHNLWSEEQVKQHYKEKGFQEAGRTIKTQLVTKNRRWKLEEKVFELYGNLYRDGVAEKTEITPFLESFGYEPDEVDMWFQVQELERRQRKWLSAATLNDAIRSNTITRQQALDYLILQGSTASDAAILLDHDRKWLSQRELADLVDAGIVDAQFAIEYDVRQGMTGEDATLRWMSYILQAYKKDLPEDCQKILTDSFSLGRLLTSVFTMLPEIGLTGVFSKTELRKLIDCLLKAAPTP